MRTMLVILATLLVGNVAWSQQPPDSGITLGKEGINQTKDSQAHPPKDADHASQPQTAIDPLAAAIGRAEAAPLKPEQKGDNAHADDKVEIDRRIAAATDSIADFALALVIATGVLAVVGLVQGFYIRQAVLNDEKSRKVTQRTYISGGGTVIDEGTRFEIHVLNHGGTAARLRWIWYGFASFNEEVTTQVPLASYSVRLSWLDSIAPSPGPRRVATIPLPSPRGAEHIVFVRFVYDDIYFGECTAGFVVRTIVGSRDPEPIAAADAYTSRTEHGAWIAPELPPARPTES